MITDPPLTSPTRGPPLCPIIKVEKLNKNRSKNMGGKKKILTASWRRCYYLHWSRDLVSPICRIKKVPKCYCCIYYGKVNFNKLLINPLHYPWCKESLTTPNADGKKTLACVEYWGLSTQFTFRIDINLWSKLLLPISVATPPTIN